MLKICLTFDYELFLGKNFDSISNILIEPTYRIINLLNSYSTKATFFVDTCCILELEKNGFNEEKKLFDTQLANLIRYGHDPQLHIHSNWLSSTIQNGQLVPGANNYRIQDLGFENDAIKKVICSGKKYLEDIASNESCDYSCIAYRAGGFAIQPEHKLIKELLECGIRIDSSVLPYMSSKEFNWFNFKRIPRRLNWRIDQTGGLTKHSKKAESLIEIPIFTRRPSLKYFLKSHKYRRMPSPIMKGEYISNKMVRNKSFPFGKYLESLKRYYPSMDSKSYLCIFDDLLYCYKKYKLMKTDQYVCLIGHPKLFDDIRLKNLENLLKLIKENSDKFEIVTMKEIYSTLKEKKSWLM